MWPERAAEATVTSKLRLWRGANREGASGQSAAARICRFGHEAGDPGFPPSRRPQVGHEKLAVFYSLAAWSDTIEGVRGLRDRFRFHTIY